jgi:hypothetical protein
MVVPYPDSADGISFTGSGAGMSLSEQKVFPRVYRSSALKQPSFVHHHHRWIYIQFSYHSP